MLKILNEDTFKVSVHKDYNNINKRVEEIIEGLETIGKHNFYTSYTEKEKEDIKIFTEDITNIP